MTLYALRLWIPDRPGALGHVASRIGALRGDVVGIEILERGGGQVVDELLISLPDDGVVSQDLLVFEISQVDGVAVEDVRQLRSQRADGGTLALQAAGRLARVSPENLVEQLCHELLDLTEGDWVVAVDLSTATTLVHVGQVADTDWVAAFLAGSQHLDDHDDATSAPPDMAWVSLPTLGAAVAVERSRWSFRAVERQHVTDLGRVVDALAAVVRV